MHSQEAEKKYIKKWAAHLSFVDIVEDILKKLEK